MLEGEGASTPAPTAARLRAWGVLLLLAAGLALPSFLERLGAHALDPFAWFAASGGLVAAGALLRGRGGASRLVLIALAVPLAAAGWSVLRLERRPPDDLSLLLADAGDAPLVRIEGTVLGRPRTREPRPGSLDAFLHARRAPALPLRVERLVTDDAPRPASGRLTLIAPGLDAAAPEPGRRIRALGVWRAPARASNPGEPDRARLAAQDGRVGSLMLSDASLIEVLPEGEGGALARAQRRLLALRGALRARALDALGGPAGQPLDAARAEGRAIVLALLLGEREPALGEARSAFGRVGVAHLMAISGFHLSALVLVGLGALRLAGDRGALEPLGAAALVLVYLLIVPGEAPVLRAGILLLALLAGEALGRRYDRLTLLGWIGCGLLLWRPMDAGSLGFQLSFGITALLLWLGERRPPLIFGSPRLGGVIERPRRGIVPALTRLGAGLRRSFMIALACWLVGAPSVLWHTGALSPLAAPATLLLTPPVVALLVLGYAGAIAGAAVPAAAPWIAGVLAALGAWTGALVRWLDALPGAHLQFAGISGLCALACTLAVLGVLAAPPRRRLLAWGLAGAALAWATWEARLRPQLPPSVALRVDMLDVGDGTCVLLRSGDAALLWDCGSLRPETGLWIVPRAARALGVRSTPDAIVTHPNIDHYGALPDVAAPLGVRRVLTTPALRRAAERRPDGPEAALLDRLAGAGVEVTEIGAGERFRLGRATAEVLWPPADLAAAAGDRAANDLSLVLLLRTATEGGERRVLLTGDIGPAAIERLRETRPDLAADVLELPHHGSVNDAALAFVSAVDPAVVLQSTGPRRLDDPRWDALKTGRAWLVTARSGAASVEIRADGSLAFSARP